MLQQVGNTLNSFIIDEIVATLREKDGPLELILRNGRNLTFTDPAEIEAIRLMLFPDAPDVPPEIGDWT